MGILNDMLKTSHIAYVTSFGLIVVINYFFMERTIQIIGID